MNFYIFLFKSAIYASFALLSSRRWVHSACNWSMFCLALFSSSYKAFIFLYDSFFWVISRVPILQADFPNLIFVSLFIPKFVFLVQHIFFQVLVLYFFSHWDLPQFKFFSSSMHCTSRSVRSHIHSLLSNAFSFHFLISL